MRLSEDNERRRKLLMLIIDFIYVDAKNHKECKNKSNEFTKGFQEALEIMRCLML